MQKKIVKPHPIFITLLVVSIAPFAYFFNKYAVSLPFLDDYWAVYDFTWIAERKYRGKGKIIPDYLFTSNLEHIIAYTKATSLVLYFFLREKFSLIHLMLIGNTSWFASIFMMGYVFRVHARASWIWLSFFPLIGISLQFYENYFWGMASHQNFSVIFFSIIALYCLFFIKNQSLSIFLALFFAFSAYLTSSTGIMVFYVGTIMLFIQKRYYSGGIWLTLSLISSVILSKKSMSDNTITLDIDKILNILKFIGGVAHFEEGSFLSIILGALLSLGFLIYIIQSGILKGKKLDNTELFFCAILLFVMFVAIVAGLKRPNVLISRYKIYSAIVILSLIPLIYLKFFQTQRHVKSLFLTITLFWAFVYNVLSTWVYSYDIKKYYEYLVADTYNWHVNDKITAQFQSFCDNDYYKSLMKDLKVEVPTNDKVDFLIKNLRNTQKSAKEIAIDTSYQIETTVVGCSMKKLSVSAVLPDNISSADYYYLVLSSETKDFVFSLFPERNSLSKSIKTQTNFSQTLTQTAYLQYLPAGNYEMSIVRLGDQKPLRYNNQKPILIEI